jgi:hypothetical protein
VEKFPSISVHVQKEQHQLHTVGMDRAKGRANTILSNTQKAAAAAALHHNQQMGKTNKFPNQLNFNNTMVCLINTPPDQEPGLTAKKGKYDNSASICHEMPKASQQQRKTDNS